MMFIKLTTQLTRLMPQFYDDNWGKFKVIRIEQLESEVKQKTKELNESLKTQILLRERLKSNTKTLGELLNQLKGVEAYLKDSNEYVYKLKQENRNLRLLCDEWVKRAIELQFEVLSARDAAKE